MQIYTTIFFTLRVLSHSTRQEFSHLHEITISLEYLNNHSLLPSAAIYDIQDIKSLHLTQFTLLQVLFKYL